MTRTPQRQPETSKPTPTPNPEKIMPLTRRRFLLTTAALATPALLHAGAQREETLSDDVASIMRQSVENASPPRLVFDRPAEGQRWLNEMSARLARFIDSELYRRRLLVMIQYEASRAALDPQIILGLIEVESRFRQYAISNVGAKGLMQVMPFWQRYIGNESHNLFDVRTNLRYGCTILRHYGNLENGNLVRMLARYNGSLGSLKYPNAVLGAYERNWQWQSSEPQQPPQPQPPSPSQSASASGTAV